MALAASLIPGYKYRIEGGYNEGEVVTIVDNTTFPDTHDQRRKITVRMRDGSIEYILPRMLGDRPVSAEAPVVVAPAAPLYVAPVDVAHIPVSDITDPMDPRLDSFRPSVSKVKRYMPRTMPNGMTDIAYLLTYTTDDYRAENDGRPANIMLKGDTQSGKTFLVEVLAVKWAEALGLPKPMPVFTLSGSSGVTDYDLFGQTTSYTDPATGRESLVWLPGLVDLAARVGGILYLDEVNAMAERVVSSLHPLADNRHHFVNRNKPVLRGGQFMPEVVMGNLDLWIIGTYNEGYRGMGEIGQAFNNRFRTERWGYDEAVESKLVKSPTIRLLADAVRTARKANKVRTPVGTAALQRLERDIRNFGPDMALHTFASMFPPTEVDVVEAIIRDSSINLLLAEERKQADANQAQAVDPDPDQAQYRSWS